jgi:predicted XRE-type DNA-binding protein
MTACAAKILVRFRNRNHIASSYKDLMALPARWPRKKHRSYAMKKSVINGIEVWEGSDNVFADLGLPNAEKLKIKSGLVFRIDKAMRALGLNQQDAAKRMGLPQAKVSNMLRGDFSNISERKLMDCLTRLGYDIEIKLRPSAKPIGRLILAIS